MVITIHKEGNLQQCQNYRTTSLISHPIKVMLKIILNGMKPLAEKIIAEEQAGFRAGRSTTEQIFNRRILYEKYLQHQQDLYHPILCIVVEAAIRTLKKIKSDAVDNIPAELV